jgi:hypothetical protein
VSQIRHSELGSKRMGVLNGVRLGYRGRILISIPIVNSMPLLKVLFILAKTGHGANSRGIVTSRLMRVRDSARSRDGIGTAVSNEHC